MSNSEHTSISTLRSGHPSISSEALVSLAVSIRNSLQPIVEHRSAGCSVLCPPARTRRNQIYTIAFSDGVKWIVRTPSLPLSGGFSERAFRSEVLTMKFIKRNTRLPVPEIYDFSSTVANPLLVPYVVMEFIDGLNGTDVWWPEEPVDRDVLEERRLKILETLAQAMFDLHKLRFEQIGMLLFEPESSLLPTGIGPCRVPDYASDGDTAMNAADDTVFFREIGPFSSTKKYLFTLHDSQGVELNDTSMGWHIFLDLVIDCVPPSLVTQPPSPPQKITIWSWILGYFHSFMTLFFYALEMRRGILYTKGSRPKCPIETFALSHPDFDLTNIIVATDGTLKGIIGWDEVQTAPLGVSWARYPGWITLDWDPAVYSSEEPGAVNTPEELESYRKHYDAKMKTLLIGADEGNGLAMKNFTTKSHLLEAVEIAASNVVCMCPIVEKIFEHCFPDGITNGRGEILDCYAVLQKLQDGTLSADVEQQIRATLQDAFL